MVSGKVPTERYYDYEKDVTKCAVDGCDSAPSVEAYLYDYYEYGPGDVFEFFEQDFTCPFLCRRHMEENEARADGVRRPRGFVKYPYTNQHHAQGYTTYGPIGEVFGELFVDEAVSEDGHARYELTNVNDELLEHLRKHPELMQQLAPRRFEELVAAIFHNQGFEVELTPQTRDGGRDVRAVSKSPYGTLLYLVECKRYAATRKVGVEVVRALYGVKVAERASHAIVATTSSFTKGAIDFATPLQYELSLRDYAALQRWLISRNLGVPEW